MRKWLRSRVGRPVYLRLADESRSILLTRVGWFGWSSIEGVDADGDDACIPLRSVTTAFAGDRVTHGFERMKEMHRKLRMAAKAECECDECTGQRRRDGLGQVSPDEIEKVLAEERMRQVPDDELEAEPR